MFIVFTSNAFAVLGLRALFFVFAGALGRFPYLKYGLTTILVFIGTKMLLQPLVNIGIAVSLGVIAIAVAASIGASIRNGRQQPAGAYPSEQGEDQGRGAMSGMTSLSHLSVASPVSYLIAVVVPALDAIIPVLPSETAVIALGVSTAGSTDPRIVLLVALAAVGAFLGDNLSYRSDGGSDRWSTGGSSPESGVPGIGSGPRGHSTVTGPGSSSFVGSSPAAARPSPSPVEQFGSDAARSSGRPPSPV